MMIANTDLFFEKALAFQNERARLRETYEKAMTNLERFQGSEGYTEEVEKLKRQYADALDNLQAKYRPEFKTVLDGMEDAIGRRPAKAPTDEQLRLLNALSLKKQVSRQELEAVANACADNPMCLSIITEIAAHNGIRANYTRLCPVMVNSRAQELVSGLRDGIEDFLKHESSRASRVAQRYYMINQGKQLEATPRRLFSDKISCFTEIGGISEEELQAFCEVSDGND